MDRQSDSQEVETWREGRGGDGDIALFKSSEHDVV